MLPIQLAKAAALWLLLCVMISGLVWLMGCASVTVIATDPPTVKVEPGFRNLAVCADGEHNRVAVKVYHVSRVATGTMIAIGALAGAPAGPGGAAGGAIIGGLVELVQALFGDEPDPVPGCEDTFGEPSGSEPPTVGGKLDASSESRPTLDVPAPRASSRPEAPRRPMSTHDTLALWCMEVGCRVVAER